MKPKGIPGNLIVAFGFLLFTLITHDARASNLLVYNSNDSGVGSLRAAIATNATLGGGNTIIFSNTVTGTITLTSGELLINNNVTILGPATGVTLSGNSASRIFHITAGTVSLVNLSITNGLVWGADGAAGTALHPNGYPGSDAQGGGILNLATLLMTNCTFSVDTVIGGDGGGGLGSVGDGGGAGAGDGAAIYNQGTATLVNCTFNSNLAGGGMGGSGVTGATGGRADGGGVCNRATLTLVHCTFSANWARGGDGGVGDIDGGNGGDARGGGLYHETGSSSSIQNTIFADNYTTGGAGGFGGSTDGANGSSLGPDVFSGDAVASQGYNLLGDASDSSGFDATGDQLNVDPMLGALADNGGPSATMALRVGSPAIDAGTSSGLARDQRGQPRYDNPNVANATDGDGADIGAYEATDLRVVNAQKTGNHLRLDFVNWLGTNYEVQARSNLVTGTWASLAGSTAGNGGIASRTISNTFSVPKQFYRIHPVP